jgi:hypothetical protein
MSNFATLSTSNLGNALQQLLVADDITVGDSPSYELCKLIYEFHPVGARMAESPVTTALINGRKIDVGDAPNLVTDAFKAESARLCAEAAVRKLLTTSRIYGAASLGIVAKDIPSDVAFTPDQKINSPVTFSIWDPLNTSGSLVLNQNPNDFDFQKPNDISVAGRPYHPSRTITLLNEQPIYIGYVSSAFGFSGRSVYQRSLYPLKSFIKTMQADDMVATKAGVLVAKMKTPGSIVNAAMSKMFGLKRNLLKEAATGNVLGIGLDESVESLNLQNLDAPLGLVRRHILENIAAGADMPAQMLRQETFAEGFGEGTEDALSIVRYLNQLRQKAEPVYDFVDDLTMARAWHPGFIKSMQEIFPELYGDKSDTDIFYMWKNSFSYKWPNLIEEPASERIKVEEAVVEKAIAVAGSTLAVLDPANKTRMLEWLFSVISDQTTMFKNPLDIDSEELLEFLEQAGEIGLEQAEKSNPEEEKEPSPKHFVER